LSCRYIGLDHVGGPRRFSLLVKRSDAFIRFMRETKRWLSVKRNFILCYCTRSVLCCGTKRQLFFIRAYSAATIEDLLSLDRSPLSLSLATCECTLVQHIGLCSPHVTNIIASKMVKRNGYI
jgi:hypothetical protein